MPRQNMDAMLWFAGRCWWFPGRQISAELQFEWRNNRIYLLEPNGSAVVGFVRGRDCAISQFESARNEA